MSTTKTNDTNVIRIRGDADAGLDLPPRDTRRWVPSRKAQVVTAVDRGLISSEQACEIYNLSAEEFQSWKAMASKHGEKGLRVTQLQKYQRRPLRRLY